MRESSSALRLVSTNSKERMFRKKNFGTIVQALWPDKPAINLAQRIGCTERAAQFYIDGERKPSARCIGVIIAEILNS